MKRKFCQRLINLLNVLREMAILHEYPLTFTGKSRWKGD